MSTKIVSTPFGEISDMVMTTQLHGKAPALVSLSILGADMNSFIVSLLLTISAISLSYYIFTKESTSRFFTWAIPGYKDLYIKLLATGMVFGILMYFNVVIFGLLFFAVLIVNAFKVFAMTHKVYQDLMDDKIDFSEFEGWEHTKQPKEESTSEPK